MQISNNKVKDIEFEWVRYQICASRFTFDDQGMQSKSNVQLLHISKQGHLPYPYLARDDSHLGNNTKMQYILPPYEEALATSLAEIAYFVGLFGIYLYLTRHTTTVLLSVRRESTPHK